jgi:hypothetical protein
MHIMKNPATAGAEKSGNPPDGSENNGCGRFNGGNRLTRR